MSKKGSWQDQRASDSPFAGLAALRDLLPAEGSLPPAGLRSSDTPAPASPATAKPGGSSKPSGSSRPNKPTGPSKAVVRLERKGRGGKDVTVVEQLGLPAAELEAWLKALKTHLGCGGAVEGDALVLQGDLRKRVVPLLETRGVRKVVSG